MGGKVFFREKGKNVCFVTQKNWQLTSIDSDLFTAIPISIWLTRLALSRHIWEKCKVSLNPEM